MNKVGQDDDSLFDADSIKEEVAKEKDEELYGPKYGSEGWNDYVMSKFHKNELFDGNPVCAGLRRVAEELLGDIVVSRPSQVWPSSDPNGPGRATVVFEIVIDWMNSGQLRTYSEVADVWHGNCDALFAGHPVATASTRAEGRALRKALKVKCLAAEELAKKDVAEAVERAIQQSAPVVETTGEWDAEDSINDYQINFIASKCKQMNINVMKFVNMGVANYNQIEDVSKETAAKILGVLNEYQTNKKEKPETILGFEENWR